MKATKELALWGLASFGETTMSTPVLYVSLVAGAVGAVVSVMSGLSFGNLRLDPEVGGDVVWRIGLMRPILGALFGLVVYALIESGSLSVVAVPGGPGGASDAEGQRLLFFAVTGFLAGFAERWAPDMLAIAQGNITGRSATPSDAGTPKQRHGGDS